MLGSEPSKVSVVTAQGQFVKDLTSHMVEGTYSRLKNAMSGFDGTFVSDSPILDSRIDFWHNYIRCERDGRDQWEGPITNIVESADGSSLNIVASGMTAYCSRETVPTSSFVNKDITRIAESIINKAFMGNPQAQANLNVVSGGYVDSRVYLSSEDTLVQDALDDFAALDYFEFAKDIYLFSPSPYPVASLKLNDESWMPMPEVESRGNTYANRVIVRGANVRGIAEAPSEEQEYYGLLTRRFDLTEVTSQAVANRTATQILNRCRDAQYLNPDSASMLNPKTNVDLANLLPGMYVHVDHIISGRPLKRLFRLGSVEVDCISGSVAVGLEPLATPGEVSIL